MDTLTAKIKIETAGAYLVIDHNQNLEAWLPKSQIKKIADNRLLLASWLTPQKFNGRYKTIYIDTTKDNNIEINPIKKELTNNIDSSLPLSTAIVNAELFEFQSRDVKTLIELLNINTGALLAYEMGLGKTRTAGAVAKYNQLINLNYKILIVCPPSLITTWLKELERQQIKNAKIISYGKIDQLAGENFDLLIVDESHYLKNWTAQRTKKILGAKKIINYKKILLLSATPATRCATDLHSSLCACGYRQKMVDFAERYAWPTSNGYGTTYSGVRNEDELNQILKKYAIKRKKSEELNLPKKLYDSIIVSRPKNCPELDLNAEQLNELIKAVEYGRGISEDDQLMKARRILGSVKALAVVNYITDQAESLEIENNPIIIWYHHTATAEILAQGLEDFQPVIFGGQTPINKRGQIVEDFQNGKIKILLAQIQSAGVGLTLTRSKLAIFAEQDWSPSNNRQAEDRIHRIGQTESVTILNFLINCELDLKINSAINWKKTQLEKII